MANHTCPTCGHRSISVYNREPADRFYEKVVEVESGCWEWTGGSRKRGGYGNFTPAPGVTLSAHRYSFALHNGYLDNDLLICHSCDNPPCVNPAHLRLGTALDNTRDMYERGRQNPVRPSKKLVADDVRAIRSLVEDGVPGTTLAEMYGVSNSAISQIVARKVWRHVA